MTTTTQFISLLIPPLVMLAIIWLATRPIKPINRRTHNLRRWMSVNQILK